MVRLSHYQGIPERKEPSAEPLSRLSVLRRRQRTGRILLFLIGSLFLLTAGWFAMRALLAGVSTFNFPWELGQAVLRGEKEGQVNFLILGFPGDPKYDGSELTDTVMVASFRPEGKDAFLFSLPRDLYVGLPGYGGLKLNAVYETAERKSGNGATAVKEVVGDILGLPIHYFVKIDFAGFEELIDELGGITVTVEKDLYDPYFPGPNYGYELLDIKAGTYLMDGAMALKYVRSRKTTSDFDRARRQQKVIMAIKARVLELDLLEMPTKALAVYDLLKKHFASDLSWREIEKGAVLLKDFDPANLKTKVFDDTPGGLLYGTKIDEVYVLKPQGDDFQIIRDFVETFTKKEKPAVPVSSFKVEVFNGTFITGLAARVAARLELLGYKVVEIGNNPVRGFEKTVVYDLTDGEKVKEVEVLAESLGAEVSAQKLAGAGEAEARVVLGNDSS